MIAPLLLVTGLIAIVAAVVLASPCFEFWFAANYPPTTARAIVAAWGLLIAWVGACIGSFLNVVIYRVPRGRSIVHGGSACPQCQLPIRPWDNVPVLSWLGLGGRCRRCRSPISLQYPVIELVTAAIFLIVFSSLFSPPARPADHGVIMVIMPLSAGHPWQAASRFFWSALIVHWLCLLLVGAKIEFDQQSLPPGLIYYAWIVQLAAVGVFYAAAVADAWLIDLVQRTCGLALGCIIGKRRSPRSPTSRSRQSLTTWHDTVHGWALTGWTVGLAGLVATLLWYYLLTRLNNRSPATRRGATWQPWILISSVLLAVVTLVHGLASILAS